jgi:predicted RNase H-like HicB family nuclease
MRIINVTYHQEKEGWWAESADVPSFFAAGASRDEVRQHARQALPEIVGEPVEELREAEFSTGPVLEAIERPGEWAAFRVGLTLSWYGGVLEAA